MLHFAAGTVSAFREKTSAFYLAVLVIVFAGNGGQYLWFWLCLAPLTLRMLAHK